MRYKLACCTARSMPGPSGVGVWHDAHCPKSPGKKLTKRELAIATKHPTVYDPSRDVDDMQWVDRDEWTPDKEHV